MEYKYQPPRGVFWITLMILTVSVPEWSKGSVLSTDVVIRVGSNPTGDKNESLNSVPPRGVTWNKTKTLNALHNSVVEWRTVDMHVYCG